MVEATDGPVVAVDGLPDLGEGSEHGLDRRVRRLGEQGHQLGRGLVGDGDRQSGIVDLHWDHEVLPSHGVGNEGECTRIWIVVAQIDDAQAGDLGADLGQAVFVQQALADQEVPQVRPGGVCGEHFVELRTGHVVARHEHRLHRLGRPQVHRACHRQGRRAALGTVQRSVSRPVLRRRTVRGRLALLAAPPTERHHAASTRGRRHRSHLVSPRGVLSFAKCALQLQSEPAVTYQHFEPLGSLSWCYSGDDLRSPTSIGRFGRDLKNLAAVYVKVKTSSGRL